MFLIFFLDLSFVDGILFFLNKDISHNRNLKLDENKLPYPDE